MAFASFVAVTYRLLCELLSDCLRTNIECVPKMSYDKIAALRCCVYVMFCFIVAVWASVSYLVCVCAAYWRKMSERLGAFFSYWYKLWRMRVDCTFTATWQFWCEALKILAGNFEGASVSVGIREIVKQPSHHMQKNTL